MRIPSSHPVASPASPTPTLTPHHGFFWALKGTGSYPENWSTLIGILTAIGGNILISFALNMQRYAHIRIDREWQEKERQRKKRNASSTSLTRLNSPNGKNGNNTRHQGPKLNGDMNGHARRSEDAECEASESDPLISPSSLERRDSTGSGEEQVYQQQSYLKSPYWWIGIVLMTVGEAGNFLAYGFAPASIVSPLGVVALISNCIIAPFMLKEPFRKRDALGVVIAVGGAVTVVLSANDNNPKLGPDEIWDLIRRWEFETYLGITVTVIAGLMVCSNRFGEKNILIDLALVGLFGGYTALSTKGVASLLSYTLWRVITFPVFYLLVAILAGTAIMQIKYLNRALQRFDATQVIPVQFVLFTLSVIGGSAILYRDFERTSGQDAGEFVGGCAMTFFGVWLITSGRPPRRDDGEEDREPEPEDAINLVGERYRDDINVTNRERDASPWRPSTSRTTSPPINIHSRYRDDPDSQPSSPTFRKSENAGAARKLQAAEAPSTPDNILPSSSFPNPWATPTTIQTPETETEPPSPPPFSRHTSTPVLPSEAAMPHLSSISDPNLIHTPRTPPLRGKSHDDMSSTPVLPQVYVSGQTGTATATATRLRRQADRLHRKSIPGPLLASPLSTTLSAMVKEYERGGVGAMVRGRDVDGLASRRRESLFADEAESSSNAAARSAAAGVGARAGYTSEPDLLGELLTRSRTYGDAQQTSTQGSNDAAAMMTTRRGRSLSGTLGDLWRGIRGAPISAEDLVGSSSSAPAPAPAPAPRVGEESTRGRAREEHRESGGNGNSRREERGT